MHCRNLCQREGLPFAFSDGATFPRLDLCTSIVHIDFQNGFLWPLDVGANSRKEYVVELMVTGESAVGGQQNTEHSPHLSYSYYSLLNVKMA